MAPSDLARRRLPRMMLLGHGEGCRAGGPDMLLLAEGIALADGFR